MREIWPFVRALAKRWWVLMSCAVFTFLGMYGAWALKDSAWYFRSAFGLGVILLVVAAFLAWREEYLANVDGPEVLIEWEGREVGYDLITLRNLGPGVAMNVEVTDFSWDNVAWTNRIEAPLLEAGEVRSFEAIFRRRVGPHQNEFGYLLGILQNPDTEDPFGITITYQNTKQTRFTRRFILSAFGPGLPPKIRCTPGKMAFIR